MCAVMCQKKNKGLYDADKVDKTNIGSIFTTVKRSKLTCQVQETINVCRILEVTPPTKR